VRAPAKTAIFFIIAFDLFIIVVKLPVCLSQQLHLWYRGLLEYVAGEFEKALPLIERAVVQQPDYGYLNIVAAVMAHQTGKESLARKYIAQAKKHNPQLNPRKLAPMVMAQPDQEKAKKEFDLIVELWG
jgi:uncharacterized protein HemY